MTNHQTYNDYLGNITEYHFNILNQGYVFDFCVNVICTEINIHIILLFMS